MRIRIRVAHAHAVHVDFPKPAPPENGIQGQWRPGKCATALAEPSKNPGRAYWRYWSTGVPADYQQVSGWVGLWTEATRAIAIGACWPQKVATAAFALARRGWGRRRSGGLQAGARLRPVMVSPTAAATLL